MTRKADFDAEEWTVLAQAPALAGLYVSQAERGGSLREGLAMTRFYEEGREQAREELVRLILQTPPGLRPQDTQGGFEALESRALAALRRADAILQAKATQTEREVYGSFVVELAQRVAEAHKEGGLLGIGGKAVSDKERAAVAAVDRALGGSSATPG